MSYRYTENPIMHDFNFSKYEKQIAKIEKMLQLQEEEREYRKRQKAGAFLDFNAGLDYFEALLKSPPPKVGKTQHDENIKKCFWETYERIGKRVI